MHNVIVFKETGFVRSSESFKSFSAEVLWTDLCHICIGHVNFWKENATFSVASGGGNIEFDSWGMRRGLRKLRTLFIFLPFFLLIYYLKVIRIETHISQDKKLEIQFRGKYTFLDFNKNIQQRCSQRHLLLRCGTFNVIILFWFMSNTYVGFFSISLSYILSGRE